MDETPRVLAATAASVALHSALLVVLASRGAVPLVLAPSPIFVTLLEAGTRTAGPGALSPKLQSAHPAARGTSAPAPSRAALPPPVVQPKPLPAKSPARATPADIVEKVATKPVASPPSKLAAKPTSETLPLPKPPRKSPAKPPPAAASSAATKPPTTAEAASSNVGTSAPSAAQGAPTGVGDLASLSTGTGSDAESTAPAWAPSARIRYEELLFSWMDRHKQYPLLAQRRGLEGSGLLRVRIGRDGRVLVRRIDRSTGETMLDQAALDMVRRAGPFPKVPAEYAGSSFEFVAPIEYRLR